MMDLKCNRLNTHIPDYVHLIDLHINNAQLTSVSFELAVSPEKAKMKHISPTQKRHLPLAFPLHSQLVLVLLLLSLRHLLQLLLLLLSLLPLPLVPGCQ